MTANEYLEIAKQSGNERVRKLIKFLQDNGYDYSDFEFGVLVGREIRRDVLLNCRTPAHSEAR